MDSKDYKKLFEPITIRNMTIRNRVIMPGMGTNLGIRNAAARGYYVERARGGVGAIVVAGLMPDTLLDESFVDGFYKWIGEPVKRHGARIGLQMWYGNQYPGYWKGGLIPEYVAPSAGMPLGAKVMLPFYRDTQCYCRELTVAEIEDIIRRYAGAARRTKEVGFDFVEVQGCHGHNLPHEFFSPLDNRRKDKYGGDLQSRMRFPAEVAKAIRNAVGEDFPFWWRLCAEEGLPGGYTLDECLELGSALASSGVDVIDVSWGHEAIPESAPVRPFALSPGEESPPGTFVPFAELFKKKTGLPVVGVGRIFSPDLAEDLLRKQKLDIVAVGRQQIADPYWVDKVARGKIDDIRPCLSCNECLASFDSGNSLKCSVNPWVGKEEEIKVERSESKKKILIIGGGPGGMQAALVAADRGHEVTLYEREPMLGGQLWLASRPPEKSRLEVFLNYLVKQIEKRPIKIEMGKEVGLDTVKSRNPDAVVLATGAVPTNLDIPGARNSILSFKDILLGKAETGNSVVIIGGNQVGLETAMFLAEKGKRVAIIEILDTLGSSLTPRVRHTMLYKLGALGVSMFTGAKDCIAVQNGLQITNRAGRKVVLKADTIVLAVGSVPERGLADELKKLGKSVYSIGDCIQPRKIMNAVEEGTAAALKI